jgi:hypothetical protein
VGRTTVALALVLALSSAYLAALLAGFVFDLGATGRRHVESASYIFGLVWLLTALGRSRASVPPANAAAAARGRASAALLAGAALLYGSTIGLGLFSDDFVLADRALARDWLPQPDFIRPLPLAIWSVLLDFSRDGAALHALSVALHGLNGVLVYLLGRRLGLPSSGAVASAALFVAYPSSVEAVVWPAAVHDLLVAASTLSFVLLAGRPSSPPVVAAATIVLLAGLLSKESAVAIPVLAAIVWLRWGGRQTAGWPVLLAGAIVCALYLVVRTTFVAIPDAFARPPTQYMLKELITRPIGTLTLPWNTATADGWPAIAFGWAAAIVGLAAAYAWRARKAVPVHVVVRCVLAVFVAVLPVYSALFITPDLENSRYLYVSTGFWTIALAAMAGTPERRTTTGLVLAAAAVAVGALGVRSHLSAWREAAALREQVLSSAVEVLDRAECSPVSLAGAPDSVRGAYVFRNGLAEAIESRAGYRTAPAADGSGCRFDWNGSTFQRARTSSMPVQATMAKER